MRKKITARQAAFLLPLFLLLVVFAIYPIITSVVYSLFDYRTNDQQVAGLYTSGNFNAPLFTEDCGYINWFLEDDITLLDQADQAELTDAMEKMDELALRYAVLARFKRFLGGRNGDYHGGGCGKIYRAGRIRAKRRRLFL
jgi:multiple sugar transport system permease protein